VAERGVLDHGADGFDFLGGELRRGGMWATRPVVERTVVGQAAPGVEPGGSELQNTQDYGEWNHLLGRNDGGQDRTFGLAIGHALGGETETGKTNEEEDQPDNGEEESNSPTKGEHLGLQFRKIHSQNICRDNRAGTTADPTGSSRARNPEVQEHVGVAFLADEVSHSVVIGTAAAADWHGTWSRSPRSHATRRHRIFCNFAAVALARPIVWNVVIRSCAEPEAPTNPGARGSFELDR